MCAQPSSQALQLYNGMNSLPSIARDATLSTTSGTNCRRENILRELRNYRDECVPNLRDRIQAVIDSVEWMGSDGKSQMFTFAFSRGARAIEFVGIAIRQHRREQLFDFTKYIYTYEKQFEPDLMTINIGRVILGILFPPLMLLTKNEHRNIINEWAQPISNDTRDLLEACFIYELVETGAAKVTNGNCLALEQK